MKRLLSVLMLFVLIPVASCGAQSDDVADASAYQPGKDYSVIPRPVKTADPSKIEVVEIFWYGCIHCFRLEPEIEDWIPTLAEDVDFVRMPAIWAEVMNLHAAMLYANEALGLTDQLHSAIFKEMNVERNQLASEAAILKFIGKQGVDEEKYRRAMNSFGVSSQVLQAKSKMGAYGVRGTPEIVINGKYKLSTSMSGSHERMLKIADALIAQERAALNQ